VEQKDRLTLWPVCPHYFWIRKNREWTPGRMRKSGYLRIRTGETTRFTRNVVWANVRVPLGNGHRLVEETCRQLFIRWGVKRKKPGSLHQEKNITERHAEGGAGKSTVGKGGIAVRREGM